MEGSDISVVAAFLAGVVSFLSPCVLPIVPAYLAVLAGSGDAGAGGRRLSVTNTAGFFAGFTVAFVLMGATASVLGQLLLEHQEAARMAGAVFIAVMGAHLAGLVRLGPLAREVRLLPGPSGSGPVGAFTLGIALTVGWTPCVGPILASILTYAGMSGTAGRGAMLLAVYAAGFVVPFLAFALIYERWSARLRSGYRWLPAVQKAAGAVLVATGLLLYFNLWQRWIGVLYGYWPW